MNPEYRSFKYRSFKYRSFALLLTLAFITGCEDSVDIQASIGEQAPAFTLHLTNGQTVQINGQPGNAKAITFMSSWCPCSNESIPLLKKMHAEYKDQNIDFLMIGIQDPESKFEQFVADYDLPFPAGYDDGNIIARTYGINAPPTTVFIDRNGKLQRIFYGNIKDMEADVYEWVRELL
jgi:peroxiredoxin